MSTGAVVRVIEKAFGPFEDPITHETMVKPVVLQCGHAFGEESITTWIKSSDNQSCPTCHRRAIAEDIKPDFALRKAIEELPQFVKKQIISAVEAQTEALKNTFKRATETEHTTPCDKIIVDLTRIQSLYSKSDKKPNFSVGIKINFLQSVEKFRHLILHEVIKIRTLLDNGRPYFEELPKPDSNQRRFTAHESISWSSTVQAFLVDSFLPEEFAQKDGLHRIPLHLAAIGNHEILVNKIVEKMHAKDLGITDISSKNALQFGLSQFSDKKLLLPILNRMHPVHLSNQDENGKTFMHYNAIYHNGMEYFNHFLEKATSEIIGTVDNQGYTPLHYAIKLSWEFQKDQIKMIEALCKIMSAEDLNKAYKKGKNFLHFALKFGCEALPILVNFLKEEAKIAVDDRGLTPIEQLKQEEKSYKNNRQLFEQTIVLLTYNDPIDQIKYRVSFSMGEKVHYKTKPKLGLGTIIGINCDPITFEFKYKIFFPEHKTSALDAKPSELEEP